LFADRANGIIQTPVVVFQPRPVSRIVGAGKPRRITVSACQ
jgi:hypothetical protein